MMARWHFWLSLVGVVLCATGAAIFWFGAEHAKEPWTWGVNLIAFSWITGILIFLPVQLWFAFDLDPSYFDKCVDRSPQGAEARLTRTLCQAPKP
jgi:hypothetical protein